MADRYWVGGSGTWLASGSSANWSTTDGGPSGASSPSTTDNAFFTANSNTGTDPFTVTTNIVGCNCANLTISGLDGVLTIAGTNNLNVYGSLTLPSTNLVWAMTGTLQLFGTSTGVNKNITTNGFVITSAVSFTTAGTDQWILQDALTITATCTLNNGTINLNGYTLTCNSFSTNNLNTRAIAFGTLGTIVIAGAGGGWSSGSMSGFSYTGTSNIRFVNSGATNATINTAGATLAQSMNFYITAGTYTLSLTSTSGIKNIDFTGFSGSVSLAVGGTAVCYGDVILSATMTTTSSTGTLNFSGTSVVQNFTTTGVIQNFNIGIVGTGNTVKLLDNFSQLASRSVSLTTGTLDINSVTTSVGIFTINTGTHAITNGVINCASVTHNSGDLSIGTGYTVISAGTYTFTAGSITINDGVNLSVRTFSSSNSNSRSIAFGTGSITTTGTGAVWNTSSASNTMTYTGTSNVIISNNTATATSVTAVGTPTTAFNFNFINGTYTLSLSTNNSYNNLNFTGFAGTVAFASTVHIIYGNLTLGASTTTSATAGASTLSWQATSGTKTITTNGRTANFGIALNGAGQTIQLADAFVQGSTHRLTIANGDFNMSGYSTSIGILTITTGTHSIANGILNCASVTHTSGGISIGTGYTIVSSGTYTFTAGSITINDGVTLSVNTFSSSNSGIRSIAFGTGAIVLTGSGTVWNTATVTNFSYTGVSNVTLTNSGFTATTITPGAMSTAQALNFYITAGTYIFNITTAGVVNNLDFTGFSGTYNQSTSTNIVYGNVVFSNTMTSSTLGGTLTMSATSGTKTITTNGHAIGATITINGVGGTFQLADNFTISPLILINGTLDINSKSTSISSFTINTGTHAISNGTLNCVTVSHTSGELAIGTGYLLVATGTYTFTAGTITINNGVDLSVGAFSSSSSSVRSIAFGTGRILLSSTGTVWNTSTVTNFSYTGVSNVTLTNSGSTATTITTGNMSSAQALNFNVSSGTYSMLLPAVAHVRDLNFTGFGGTFNNSTFGLNCYGNVTLSNAMSLLGSGNVYLHGTCNLTSSNIAWPQSLQIYSTTSNVTLADSLTSTSVNGTVFINGDFDSNNQTVTTSKFTASGFAVGLRNLKMRSSEWNITGDGIVWDVSDSQLTLDSGTSNINFTSSLAKTFSVDGKQWYNINQAGAGDLIIGTTDSVNTFNDVANIYNGPSTVKFGNNSTSFMTNFSLSGSAGKTINLTGNTPFTLSKSSGNVIVSYLTISNSNATGGANWLAPPDYGNSNGGFNTGWDFSPFGPTSAVLSNMIAFF